MYKKDIAGDIVRVTTDSKQICAIPLKSKCGYKDLVTISVYMPCDNRRACTVNTEFCDTLQRIEQIMYDHDNANSLICGDWNTDPGRRNDPTHAFNEFIVRNNLHLCWNHPRSQHGDTYVNHSLNHNSCIDHFILSEAVFQSVQECIIYDSPLNPSDRCNVGLCVTWDIESQATVKRVHMAEKVAWHRVNDTDIEQHQCLLNEYIDDIVLPADALYCSDVCCTNNAHIQSINTLCNHLIEACLEMGDKSKT